MTAVEPAEPSRTTLTPDAAAALDQRIISTIDATLDCVTTLETLLAEARATDLHVHLGFPSWTSYLADRLEGRWRLRAAERVPAAQLLAEQGMSVRAIAAVTGASKSQVGRDLASLPPTVPNGTVVGLDGREYHRPPPRRQHHETPTTDTSDVWLTPRRILAALGTFDLDPAAAPDPAFWPTARRHITLPEDGLAAPWSGRVWLNPPYSNVWTWMARLADHGRGTAIVFARTDTQGFVETVWGRATSVLFLHGRVAFHRPDGSVGENGSGAPSCLVAYGKRDAKVLRTCGLPGTVVTW